MSYASQPGSLMKVLRGIWPYWLGSCVPCHGKKPMSEPLWSFWCSACSVSDVSALGFQVSDGANTTRLSSTWSTCVPLSRPTATRR